MSGRTKRRGFTLIELLVVISIIGMLMALLLPAIQSARESGRRNTCANNMRNIGLAAIQWEGNKKFYPPYAAKYGADAAAPKIGSYVVAILPFLERADLYKMWTDPSIMSNPVANRYTEVDLEIAGCPSDPAQVQATGALAFVINSGVGNPPGMSDNEDQKLNKYASGGVSHREVSISSDNTMTAPVWRPTRVGADFVSANDGTTFTLLLSENLQAYTWSDGTTDPNTAVPTLRNRTTFVWWTGTSADPNSKINVDIDAPTEPLPTTDNLIHARPSSRHVGGVNVFFTGGNSRYITDDIHYSVFKQLMSPKAVTFGTPVKDLSTTPDNPIIGDDAF